MKATIVTNPSRRLGSIDPNIYGQFLSRRRWVSDEGLHDPANPAARPDGIREDVFDAVAESAPPVIRWPGGCTATSYEWLDGVGPKDKRPNVIDAHFGYGVGNGVPLMEEISGLTFVENNVHNIYLQFLLEGGIQSLLLFLFMVGHILIRPAEGQQRNIKAFLFLYLMLALIEFSGYEAYFWFFVGMFYAREDARRARLRQTARTRRDALPTVAHHA